MKSAPREARKTVAPMSSSALPQRLAGVRAMISAFIGELRTAAVMSVSIHPGCHIEGLPQRGVADVRQLGEYEVIACRIARETGHGCAGASQAHRHGAADSAIATGLHGDTATQVKKRTIASHRASREFTIR